MIIRNKYTNKKIGSSTKNSKRCKYTNILGDGDDPDTNIKKEKKRKDEIYRPKTDISLSSLQEALEMILTYNSSRKFTKHIIEGGCQAASDKKVVEENVQNTMLCVEHNTSSYMKEIVAQSILKSDFLVCIKVLCHTLETENSCLIFDAVYFRKCALLIHMYSDNNEQLLDFLNLVYRRKGEAVDLNKIMKLFLTLKPLKKSAILPVES